MKTIFCTVHGYTHWDSVLLQVINTPEFQRLKRIKQLAAVHHVFPCATHTRFEHSIGVGHLAERFGLALKQSQPELHVDLIVLKLAGLCHDLGHGPLSHAFDRFLTARGQYSCHEDRSAQILRHIVTKYNIPLAPAVVENACELISPKHMLLPRFWYQIIANDLDKIDVDKLDYLQRDALYTGLGFSIEIERFFLYSRVIDDRLCYSHDAMPFAINHMLMVRHQLHHQVYQHPVVRGIELMYLDVLTALGDVVADPEMFTQLSDAVFDPHFSELMRCTGRITADDALKAQDLLRRIDSGDLYQCVVSECILPSCIPHAEAIIERHADSKVGIFDLVIIGYACNPVFNIEFFRRDGSRCVLNERETSSAFPKRTLDCWIRLYSR